MYSTFVPKTLITCRHDDVTTREDLRARAAIHTRHTAVTRHAVTVATNPASLARACVVGHCVWVTSGCHLVAVAVTTACLLVAIVDCESQTQQ